MTRGIPLVVVLAGFLLPRISHADVDVNVTREKVTDAILANDVKALRKLIAMPVGAGNVWFADARCAKKFTTIAMADLKNADVPAFVKCLKNAGVKRITTDPIRSVEYEPGAQLTLILLPQASGLPLLHVSGDMEMVGDTAVPAVMPETMEAHRAGGEPTVEPDAATKASVDKDPKAVAFATISYCVGATGKVTKAEATIVPKAGYGSYVAHALEQARAWTFKPFTAKTKPVGACSAIDVQYPAGRHISFEMMQSIDPKDPSSKK